MTSKEERDNHQTEMNIGGIGCLSQWQHYRVVTIQAAVGVPYFQTQKCSEWLLPAAGQQQVHSLLLLLISQKDALN